MKRLLAVLLLSGAVALASQSCGSARRSMPIAGPMMNLTAEQQAGQVAFQRFCHRCHPHGEAGLAPALNNKPIPGWLIRFQIRHGLGAMPAFSEDVISDEEVDQIIAYAVALRRHR
jgi:mono/diheme cytochrome c family protein